jgi:hypothetical protein
LAKPAGPPSNAELEGNVMRITHAVRAVAVAAILGGSVATAGIIATSGVASASASHVNDCTQAPNAIFTGTCTFLFFDGSGNVVLYTPTKWKDTISSGKSETEVFIGTTANEVPNSTGLVVVWSPANNPNGPTQTCLSLQTNKTTLNWTDTIQPDGEWNLTCNFSK